MYSTELCDDDSMESGRSSVWLERYVRDVEVAGSNPVAPTIFFVLSRPVLYDWIFFVFASFVAE